MNRFDDKFHGFDPINSDDIVMQVQIVTKHVAQEYYDSEFGHIYIRNFFFFLYQCFINSKQKHFGNLHLA